MELFSLKDVSFAYEGNTVVSGLNFTVNSGDYICIVGENGSGKSTLVKGLLRLIAPQSGNISMGDDLKKMKLVIYHSRHLFKRISLPVYMKLFCPGA